MEQSCGNHVWNGAERNAVECERKRERNIQLHANKWKRSERRKSNAERSLHAKRRV